MTAPSVIAARQQQELGELTTILERHDPEAARLAKINHGGASVPTSPKRPLENATCLAESMLILAQIRGQGADAEEAGPATQERRMTDERTPYRFEVALRKWRAQLGILEKGRARNGVLSVGIFACHRVRFRLYSAPFVRFLLSNGQHSMTTKAKRWRYNRYCGGMVPKT